MDVELQNTLSSAVLPIAPGRCSMKPTTISATSAITTTKTISTRSFTSSMGGGGARKLSRTRIGLAGFFILGTIVIGPNVSRDASASPVDDSDGPSLPAAHEAPIGAAGTGSPGAFLAPAFAADDVLGLPQGGSGRGGEQVTANLASNLAQPNAASSKTDGARGSCPTGMVEVEGDYCPNVEQKCLRWLDPETQMRCAEFDTAVKCDGKTSHRKFCIDQYEYPNVVGEKPVIMKTWYDAGNACKAEGKRLCASSEWTLACEGQDHLPYPYGFERNSETCNIDKPHPDVNEKAIANPSTRDAEVERLWQGEPSGTREACVSPYGVHDMTGNVDEWVVNESGHPYKSGLKGGYWGPVRDRCRPMTVAHNETFIFYQIGFRCCADEPSNGTDPGTTPKGVTGTMKNVRPVTPSSSAQGSSLTGS